MADTPRSIPPPTSGSGARPLRYLALIGIVLAVLTTAGFLFGRPLLCGTGVAPRGCPAAVTEPRVAGDSLDESPDEATAPGRFVLPSDSGVELDTLSPTAASTVDAGDLFYDNRRPTGGSLYTADHPVAVWTGDEPPDASDCLDAIVSAGIRAADPAPGRVLCVQTTEGRIAALTVTEVRPDGLTFVSTVWN